MLFCPIMHLFMHKSHGLRQQDENDRRIQPPSENNNNHIRKVD
ncbi:DUF2933 domain-containing protein [Vibrio sp. F74]